MPYPLHKTPESIIYLPYVSFMGFFLRLIKMLGYLTLFQ